MVQNGDDAATTTTWREHITDDEYTGNPYTGGTLVVVAVSPIRAKLEKRITGLEDAMTGKKPKEQMRKGKGIQPTEAQGPPPRITPETANPALRSPKESK